MAAISVASVASMSRLGATTVTNVHSPKPPVLMESRDERITIRSTSSQREMFEAAARAAGDEVSRYIRECAVMGLTAEWPASTMPPRKLLRMVRGRVTRVTQ